MITYHVGNLFDVVGQDKKKQYIIPHVCNDEGVWGSGFVVQLGSKYPDAKDKYLHLFKGRKKNTLGLMQTVAIKGELVIVANMIAQHGLIGPTNPIPLKYAALIECMREVADLTKACKLLENVVEIHAPLFGSGLAGGNWDFIEILINEIWCDVDVHVHQLKGQELRPKTT